VEANRGLPVLRGVEDLCYDAGQSITAQVVCGAVCGEQGRWMRVESGDKYRASLHCGHKGFILGYRALYDSAG
jgi:hypothetical protein